MTSAPISRHTVAGLVFGAWSMHHNLRLVEALYVQLAVDRGAAW